MNIHTFPGKAKGKRNPINKPKVSFGNFLITLPSVPLIDLSPRFYFPMDGNDSVGDCVVASWDHLRQTIIGLLTGIQKNFTQTEIWDFYKTQNPEFDPNGTATTNGPGSSADNGMDIQTFLEYLVTQKYILGFANVDYTNEAEMKAALYIGLGLITGVQVADAQMTTQFDTGIWDYIADSPVDGGHSIPEIGYLGTPDNISIVTWAKVIQCTQAFIKNQMDECWFVLMQEHVDHPSFRDHFNLTAFSQAVSEITNGKVIIPVNPILKIGDSGPTVIILQQNLNQLGFNLIVDGKFGPITQTAVINIQNKTGLTPDGIAGPLTLAKIAELINPENLLNAIIDVESGGDDNAEGDLSLENHAYGALQIRQGVCDNINASLGTSYQAKDCLGNRALSVEIWNRYWQVNSSHTTNEDRARCWNGGLGWKEIYTTLNKTPAEIEYCENLDIYWSKVEKYL